MRQKRLDAPLLLKRGEEGNKEEEEKGRKGLLSWPRESKKKKKMYAMLLFHSIRLAGAFLLIWRFPSLFWFSVDRTVSFYFTLITFLLLLLVVLFLPSSLGASLFARSVCRLCLGFRFYLFFPISLFFDYSTTCLILYKATSSLPRSSPRAHHIVHIQAHEIHPFPLTRNAPLHFFLLLFFLLLLLSLFLFFFFFSSMTFLLTS
jgi:hypothetical protein